MRVFGKGRKERMVYLNHACMNALNDYLEARKKIKNSQEEPALFLSKRGSRISKRRVQQIVEDALQRAGLSGQGYSTNVDTLTLKEILGHKSTATTEIYTHLSNAILQEAADHSPLAEIINHPASDESEPDAPDVVSVVLPDVLPENENKEQSS